MTKLSNSQLPTQYSSPTIFVVAGSPAAGKTSFVREGLAKGVFPSQAFLHDCDASMVAMEGYQRDLSLLGPAIAFRNWELVAREKAEKTLSYAIEAGVDVIYDRSCAILSSFEFLREVATSKGYKVVFHVLSIEKGEAIARAKRRESEMGRHMPEEILQERLEMVSALWPRFLSIATEAYLYDSNESPAKLILQYKDKKISVFDQVLFDRFIYLGQAERAKKALENLLIEN